jgi:DNA-nicking Smr family endonuclease
VLRELVIEALGKPPLLSHILAFSTAPRAHGGEGALVVLLRRRSAQG